MVAVTHLLKKRNLDARSEKQHASLFAARLMVGEKRCRNQSQNFADPQIV
jgi:hypothetical protein